jgi:hypothetical protein
VINHDCETKHNFPLIDVDAGVLCRHLGMGMSGRATYLPRDWSFVRADAYGVYCHGNETDPHDCRVNKNDTTYDSEIRFRVINHDCQTKHKIWHIFVSSVLM